MVIAMLLPLHTLEFASALRGSCGIHLRMSCRKLGFATLEEGRRRGSILVGPAGVLRNRSASIWQSPTGPSESRREASQHQRKR